MNDIPKHSPTQEGINVRSKSPNSTRERLLSNFSEHALKLGGQTAANVEAFVQGIKYPEASQQRELIFQLPAGEAKRMSPEQAPETIEWGGESYEYKSLEHYRLEAAAIFAKFDQNEEALEALLATGSLPLTHDLGKPESTDTCLPADVFTQILTEVREHFFAEMGTQSLGQIEPHLYVTPEIVDYVRGVAVD